MKSPPSLDNSFFCCIFEAIDGLGEEGKGAS
jgi:hypothetical protein